MKFKKILIWSCIKGHPHPLLSGEEQKISYTMPQVEILFPGIDYYSCSGFWTVMRECVAPALKKLFPDLDNLPSDKMTREEMLEISQFLPSKGYEWQDSERWKKKFNKLLAA